MRISDWSSDVCSSDLDERSGPVARNRLWQRAGIQRYAADRHAADPVHRSEGDGAAGHSATTFTAPEGRTRGLAIAARQVGFVYDGAVITFARDEGDDGRCVGATDGQGRRRSIAVAVGNLTGEDRIGSESCGARGGQDVLML